MEEEITEMMDLSKSCDSRVESLEQRIWDMEEIHKDLQKEIDDLLYENNQLELNIKSFKETSENLELKIKHLSADNEKLSALAAMAEKIFMQIGSDQATQKNDKPKIILQ